jgi:hypothetical protein
VGIDPDKFWYYTWKEVSLLGESWNINHNLEWERTRFLAATIYSAKAEKRSQLVKPTDLFKLPQDRFLRNQKPKSTRADFDEMVKRIDKLEAEGKFKPQ